MTRALTGTWAWRDWAVLEVLSRAAADDAGWRWGGVGGWMLYEDVDARLTERVSEVLPHLAGLGLAQRVDVRPPGRRRPVWMYRVTGAGLRALARRTDTVPPALAPVGDDGADAGTFFIQRRTWAALAALQARARVGEGWMTLRELNTPDWGVDHDRMSWLARCGLVERKQGEEVGGGKRWRFRATAQGRRVVPAGAESSFWTRVRLGGETRGAASARGKRVR